MKLIIGFVLLAMWPVLKADVAVSTTALYYSNTVQYNFAVSANNFYVATLQSTNSLQYKAIGNGGNSLTPITVAPLGAIMIVVSAYTQVLNDVIWSTDLFGRLYCGSISSGMAPAISPANPFRAISSVSVGPSGVWAIDFFGILYNKSSTACNSGGPAWVNTGISPVNYIASGSTGVYYNTMAGIFHKTSALASPVAVTSGGPTGILAMSASNVDDTLIVVDQTNNVWLLDSPLGNWSNLAVSYINAASYSISSFYGLNQDIDNNWNIDQVALVEG